MPDFVNLAARMFGTPLLIDPAKAAVIMRMVGPQVLGGTVDLRAPGVGKDAEERAMRPAASIIGDELHHNLVRRRTGYSRIGNIAVISIAGTLVRRGGWVGAESGMTSYEGISAQIRAAAKDEDVAAIALEIDSFGGEAAGMFDLAAQIRAVREVKPVHAFIADYALSAGYGIAAQADTITVPPWGMAGSIGVVAVHTDIEQKLENEGVRVTLIYSGDHKVDGNPYEQLPEAVRAKFQSDNDAIWAEFADLVAQGRRGKITAEGAIKTQAAVYRGQKAVDAGLADEVAEARDAFNALREKYNTAPVAATAAAVPQGGVVLGAPGAALLGERPGETIIPTGGRVQGAAGRLIEAGASQPKETVMSKDDKTPDAKKQPVATTVAPQSDATTTPTADAAVQAERERASKITTKVAQAGLPASFGQKLIAGGVSLESAFDQILDEKAAKANDGGDVINGAVSTASVGMDGIERLSASIESALMHKVGLEDGAANQFTNYSLRELARECLNARGASVQGNIMALASAAFVPATAGAMHSTSDFGNILVNIANKSMLKGFAEAPETFQLFTSVGRASDFKPTKRVGLEAFSTLDQVAEGAEFKYGTMDDHAETVMLATYGKLFAITRQTIINDDLDAFSKVPQRLGRAAKRTIGDLVFAVLNDNPAMADGKALFHADHGNLAVSGSLPSEVAINAAINAMGDQTQGAGKNKINLNIDPKFLLSGRGNRAVALQSLKSTTAPDDTSKAGTTKQSGAYNTTKDAAEPIFDARVSGNAWFMLADPDVYDGIEVCYLDGVETPFLDQQDGWSVDGIEHKVRIDAAAKALAHQTLYKNPGE